MAGGEARAGRREGRPSLRACGAVAWALAALLALAAGLDRASGQAPERVAPLGPGDLVALDFDNADIRVVIKHISELTGRNFLVDEKVRGRVTIITPRKIRVRDVYRVFQSLLHIYGFTTIPAGEVTKIVPLREAARSGVPTIPARDPAEVSRTDRVVTGIIRVVHAEASALASILRPMVAREGSLLPYGPANALILTDTAANVRRLTSIIRAVDVAPAAARVAVVRLKYASAKELAGTLGQLVETAVREPTPPPARRRAARPPRGARAPTPARPAVKILPDERVNALILVAPAAEMVRVRRLVKSLDVPAPPERARIHVYRLENAVAEDLARVLTQQIGKPAPAEPGAKPAAPSPEAPPRVGVLLKDVAITPDKATNSLVVRASPEDFQALTEIIRKLDIRRSQVLVEALIAEMTLDKARELGVEWRVLNLPKGRTQIVGGTNLPVAGEVQGIINQFATAPFAAPSGLVLGAARGLITFRDQTFLDLRGLIRAFQADSDINILSTPQILTTDNEEAEIVVGENRPFVTRAQTTPEGGLVRTFEFRDVGIKLRITPHISPNRFVRLKIFQEILNFVSEVEVGAVTTTKRQATTSVIAEDGQTVVIGGLIRDDTTDAVTKVPLLGDLPVLGLLFRAKRKTAVKTNLLIFITPRIVTTPEEHRQLTERKRAEAEGLIELRPPSLKDRL